MNRIALLLVMILCVATVVVAQKTVHVREYRRKDGTVVRAHDRRPPRRSSPSSPQIASESSDELSDIEITEPYATVDLGEGSFYTPGGTGVVRPRRVGP